MSKKLSAPAQLMALVWGHNREATGWSWQRLNQSMSQALNLCISAGMEFALSDFSEFCKAYNGSRWMGDSNGGNGFAEGFYTHAIATDNLSACHSFEAFKRREPFIFEGKRLGLRSEIRGFKVRTPRGVAEITSFSACGTYLNAVARGWKDKECKTYGILQRISYTREELRTHNAAKQAARPTKTERLMARAEISIASIRTVYEQAAKARATKAAARIDKFECSWGGYRQMSCCVELDEKGNAKCGCQNVSWVDLRRFAKKQGWTA